MVYELQFGIDLLNVVKVRVASCDGVYSVECVCCVGEIDNYALKVTDSYPKMIFLFHRLINTPNSWDLLFDTLIMVLPIIITFAYYTMYACND